MPGWVCRTPLFSFNVKGVGRWFQQARSFFCPYRLFASSRMRTQKSRRDPPWGRATFFATQHKVVCASIRLR